MYYYYDEEDEKYCNPSARIELCHSAKAGEKLSLQTYRCFTFFYLVAPMEPGGSLEERADVTRQKLLNYIKFRRERKLKLKLGVKGRKPYPWR